MVQLTFHGAAETVTGSRYVLETDSARVLFDCGLFQGLKELRERNWARPEFDPQKLDACVLTHAHIDHIGYLPRVVKLGFRRTVWSTSATADLADILLRDSANTQESDAEYANRKGFSKHRPALPLYEERDVEQTLKLFRTVERGSWFNPAGDVWCRYTEAGHLLGSSSIEVQIRGGAKPLTIVFSGDVGRYQAPLYHDPAPPPPCDYLICESTYGDRDHPPVAILDQLCEVVNDAIRRGGVMVVASFAVGRAQQLIYLLHVLAQQRRIPKIPIYLDSPMAVSATQIFVKHAGEHDLSEAQLTGSHCVLSGSNVHLSRTVDESKRINDVRGPAVIIASSGMMTGGRILHHIKRRVVDARNTVVLGGYQAQGTRGRDLQNNVRTIRIHGRDFPVRAHVAEISAISGHAGRSELLRWLQPLAPPVRAFITHGELGPAHALADVLRDGRGWDVVIPKQGQTFTLEPRS
jgi:metallo-beta-lactamase family protein